MFDPSTSSTPTLDALTLAVMDGIDRLGKGAINGLAAAGGAIGNATTTSVAKAVDSGLSDKMTAPKGETVKEAKALAIEQEKHREPTQMSASVDSALSKAGLKQESGKSEGMAMANASAFVGNMVSVGGIEDLGKPIAIATQTQSMGLAMG